MSTRATRPRVLCARVRSARVRGGTAYGGDDGVTLIELLVTMLLTGVVLTILLPFMTAVGGATTTTGEIATATSSARLALEGIQLDAGSASKVCLPTSGQLAPSLSCPAGGTTPSANGPSAYLRVLSDAFGTERWVQWQVVAGALEEQSWPDTSPAPSSEPWNVIASPVTSATPFSCVVAGGSPIVLDVTLVVQAGHGSTTVTVPVTSTVSALDTSYATPKATSC